MHTRIFAVLTITSSLVLSGCLHSPGQTKHGSHHSKYAGQQSRLIKSLSNDDIEELKRGGGWGLAKAAELNGMPGPAHLLELQSELGLEEPLISKIKKIHGQMQSDAIVHGKKLIELEQALDLKFQQRTRDPVELKSDLLAIAQTRAQLRFVHLSAHLSTVDILTEDQIEKYNDLRGYGSGDPCAKVPAGHNAARWRKHNGCDD